MATGVRCGTPKEFSGVCLLVGLSLMATGAEGSTARREPFGTMPDGAVVEAVRLSNAKGVSARILSYGATLQSLKGPDRRGHVADVLLGYDSLDGYIDKPNFFGVTVGRYANRIAGGRFTLDGKSYQLPLNDKTTSLHGGKVGFDKRLWKIVSMTQGPSAAVAFALTSEDGDQGYPGRLEVKATYALDEGGALIIDYEATTSAPTVVNMTNHAIFNLSGEGSPEGILGHKLRIPAGKFTPVNLALIPTGELKPVAGTVFDFTRDRIISAGLRDGTDPQIIAGRGYDHNFALDAGLTAQPKLAARLESPSTGRVLEVLSTEPGVQVYTGNFLDGTLVGKSGHLYRMGDGIALEPQKFPDAPNEASFVSARVDPGKPYHHRLIFQLSTVPQP
jgi:aldose 1-epimerase